MHTALLSAHSVTRWILFILLVYTLIKAYSGMMNKSPYTKTDEKLRKFTVSFAHLQLLIGLILYFTSPLTAMLMNNFKTAVSIREIRFYGMEHSVTMLIAVVLLTVGSVIAKKKTDDAAKFKAVIIWFTIALVLILLMTPWPISPFSERPFLRLFN